MKDMPVANVRNLALLGHTGSGKTALLDALLFKLGVNDRKGSPENGTSMADWTDEEKDRKISVWAKPFDLSFKTMAGARHRLVVTDTPGYADFVGQMLCALSVADAGLLMVDATSGLQVGATRAWRQCEKAGIPRGIVISGIDKENADFDGVLASIQSVWGARCVPVTVPVPGNASVVDVLGGAAAPGDMAATVEQLKTQLIEAAAETNDALMEKYLGGEALSPDEIAGGLRESVRAAKLVPVFAASAKSEAGLPELLEGIVRLFPSPADRKVSAADGAAIDPSPTAPFAGFVWRTISDPFVGQLSLCRVFGGTMKGEGEIYNVTKGAKERIGGLIVLNGKKQEAVTEAHAGDIVALAKLKSTGFNDSLGPAGATATFAPIVLPNPVMAYAVTPKTQGDDDKLMGGLQRVAEEDPTLRLERNVETHEVILSGMGDAEINVAVDKMRKHSKVEVILSTPKVAYKETVTGRGEGHYKHKKQTGGRGQYGEVYLRVEPKQPDEPEWFVNAVVGGTIPGNFIPAVQKGLVEGMTRGPLAGSPVVNVKVVVYDGSYHDVDSSEIAFKIAGARALKEGMLKSKPVLLEPIMKVRVMIPDQCMGDVTGDLNHRRGRILGMDTEDGMQVLTADIPQAELFQYSSQLRSMTGGRGTFEMEFSRLEIVPSNIAQKIIAEAQKNKQEESEE